MRWSAMSWGTITQLRGAALDLHLPFAAEPRPQRLGDRGRVGLRVDPRRQGDAHEQASRLHERRRVGGQQPVDLGHRHRHAAGVDERLEGRRVGVGELLDHLLDVDRRGGLEVGHWRRLAPHRVAREILAERLEHLALVEPLDRGIDRLVVDAGRIDDDEGPRRCARFEEPLRDEAQREQQRDHGDPQPEALGVDVLGEFAAGDEPRVPHATSSAA
ncbi:MAG: hypothetical protein EBR86_08065 [Planctomycetia bacterium]|nr:hypothetical protein [Planctomycetia bacterium]